MNLKDAIRDGFRDRIEKQPNPWQPYRGPSGGQGWMNAITGEVRYQPDRPAPGEGTPEDAAPQAVGELDEEIPETLDEAFDPVEPTPEDLLEHLEPGMEVTAEVDGEEYTGEVGTANEDGIYIDTLGAPDPFDPEDIVDHPVELEPPGGWADGWTDAPQDWGDLDEGQTIEVYDLEAGEYHEATVDYVGEDGGVMDITLEGEETPTTIGDVDYADDVLVTAAEEPGVGSTPGMEFDPADYEEGDQVLAYNPYSDETTIVRIDAVGDGGFAGVSEEEGSMTFSADVQDEWQIVDPENVDEVIEGLPEDLEPDSLDEIGQFEGELAIVDHPAEGTLVGEIEIIDHDEDGHWLYVGDSEVGVPLDDPEHPLHGEFVVEEIESPYEGYDPATDPQWITEGDELVLQDPESDERFTVEVEESTNDDVLIENYGWHPREDLEDGTVHGVNIDSAAVEPTPIVPEDAEEWHDMTDAAFHETNVGDTIWWKDPETGVPVTAEVTGKDGAWLEVDHPDVDDVNAEQIQGVADTAPGLPDSDWTLSDVYEEQEIEVAYRTGDGSIETVTGMVTDVSDHHDDLEILMADGDSFHFGPSDDYAIADANVDAGFGSDEWQGRDPADLASEIEEAAGLEHARWKLDQQEKNRLRAQLYTKFPKDSVDKFYELQSGGHGSWKSNSGSSDAETYERAFRDALGIDAPHREKGGRTPPREVRAIAETAAVLSQRHFEAQYGDGTPLYRGTSPAGARKLVASYFADPAAEEYDSPFLAINNFSSSHHTAKRFEGEGSTPGALVEWQTSTEDVVAMHDYLFTQQGSHEQEDEITLRGDMDSIPAEFIQLKSSDHGPQFHLTPDEWSEDEAREFVNYLHEEGNNVDGVIDWEEGLIHNVLEIERDLREEHGLDTEYNEFFQAVRDRAGEAGIDHEYVLDPDSIHLEGIDEVEDFREEMEIQFEYNGQEYEGEILDVDEEAGGLTVVEDFHGEQFRIEPRDIEQVSYSPEPYGPGADALTAEDWESNDFGPGDPVYVAPYGQGNRTDEGIVMDVEDGVVEVSIDGKSDWFDLEDPTENDRIAPKSLDELIDDESEGSGGEDGEVEEDYEFAIGDPVAPLSFSVGQTIPIKDFHDDVLNYTVMDVPEDNDGPVELEEDESGARFLYWPDGDIEQV